MNDFLKVNIPLLPHRPGVYLMKDSDDRVIYVGKAKDLYKRVSQYFLRPQAGKVLAMVSHVDHFDTIITKTEKEAFLLEINLIHKYYPRYNILLKDGKSYPYIALKRKGDLLLKITRTTNDRNYFYFGPFPTSSYAYEVIDLLNRLFPTRKCKNIPSSPCLYYHLNQCLAPCINKIEDKQYESLYEEIKAFLDGHDENIVSSLKIKMLAYSESEQFEKANEIKKTLLAIEHIHAKQGIDNRDKTSRDVFAYSMRDNYLSIAILTYRRGQLLGKDLFVVEQFGDVEEQVIDLVLQYYQNHPLPSEILINIAEAKSIEDIYDVHIKNASKGIMLELIEMATLNAKQGLDAHFMSARLEDDDAKNLDTLAKILNIKTPLRIELFDNSHIQGDSSVGAVVVFINAQPVKKMYRKFNIEGKEKRDDLASMKEVISRRYKRLLENNEDMPDLILVDGGLIQVEAGKEALKSIGVDIPLFGLYKNDKHQTKGLIDIDGRTYSLDDYKSLFFLLVRMQDEVHRFAISFHHQKHLKKMTNSVLDNIEGLGKKRMAIIRERYQNIDDLFVASIEELSQLVPSDVAISIKKRLDDISKR